jgi:hypothetical protein
MTVHLQHDTRVLVRMLTDRRSFVEKAAILTALACLREDEQAMQDETESFLSDSAPTVEGPSP